MVMGHVYGLPLGFSARLGLGFGLGQLSVMTVFREGQVS